MSADAWVGVERRSAPRPKSFLSERAQDIFRRSRDRWPKRRPLALVGQSTALHDALCKLRKVAAFDQPVLITGESGVGKELAARAVYLLGPRNGQAFVSVNCPQYQEGNLTVSELFGHEKGSFTGAVGEREGCFEEADGGVVFLDEIGDLHMSAQVMLLRALAEGEYRRIGSNRTRRMNVRVVACTNRSPDKMVAEGAFRNDLFFRLRYFAVQIPPLREREHDWRLIIQYFLDQLAIEHAVVKRFSRDAMDLFERYHWPGNVRELGNIITTGYAMADGPVIEPEHFVDMLEESGGGPTQQGSGGAELLQPLLDGHTTFWETVYRPFLDRDLNRQQVRALIQQGLALSGGSYRDLLPRFGVASEHYQKFMDFLRHHRVKP
ncbi:MAG: sigma 54-interacting transcriptional regulator [Pseudomonadota bacterium]